MKIVNPDGDYKLSGYFPDNWEITEEIGGNPIPGYKLPKYSGSCIYDDSVWDHLHYSCDNAPQEVGIFRTVYELEGGEMPILDYNTNHD